MPWLISVSFSKKANSLKINFCQGCKSVREGYPQIPWKLSHHDLLWFHSMQTTFIFFSAYYLLHFSLSLENDSTFLLLSTQNYLRFFLIFFWYFKVPSVMVKVPRVAALVVLIRCVVDFRPLSVRYTPVPVMWSSMTWSPMYL